MPRKDRKAQNAYQREWYHREANRRRTIAAVAKRKHTQYAGTCLNCGGPTVGSSKNNIPVFCSKPECASVQRAGRDQWGRPREEQRGGTGDDRS